MNKIILIAAILFFVGGCSQQSTDLPSYSEQTATKITFTINQALSQLASQASAGNDLSYEDQQFIDHLKAKSEAGRGFSKSQKNRLMEIKEQEGRKLKEVMNNTAKAFESLVRLMAFMEAYLEYCEYDDQETRNVTLALHDSLTRAPGKEYQHLYWEAHQEYQSGLYEARWSTECAESNMNDVLKIFQEGAKNIPAIRP